MDELVNQRRGEAVEVQNFDVLPLEPPVVVQEVVPVVVPPLAVVKKPRKKKVAKVKRGPGRPPVYNKVHRKMAAAAMRKVGLTPAVAWLAENRDMKVSLTFLLSVAKEYGIKFEQGRRVA